MLGHFIFHEGKLKIHLKKDSDAIFINIDDLLLGKNLVEIRKNYHSNKETKKFILKKLIYDFFKKDKI